jgi:hypothetical protein
LLRPVCGALDVGTAFYAPIGEVLIDGARMICHLCGRSFRSVTAHLRGHGWTKTQYCEAFGLERSQALEGPETRRLRSAAFSARLTFDPAIRHGSAAGRARARAGELTRDAAAAARGRPFPLQRRWKNAQAQAARSPGAAPTARRRADRRLASVAASAARNLGYGDIGSLVTGGWTLAPASRP